MNRADRVFARALTRLAPELRAFAKSLCRDVIDADDLVQETFLKAWAARARYRNDDGLRAWTFTILRNGFYSSRRKAGRVTSVDPAQLEDARAEAPQSEPRLMLEALRGALGELPQDQRDTLLLAALSGMDHSEIAQAAGCAVGTVKSRLSRARRTVAAKMESGAPAPARAAADPSAALMQATAEAGRRLGSRRRPS